MNPVEQPISQKNGDAYHRRRLIEKHQMWQGRQVKPLEKKEPKMINISITDKK